MARVAPSERFRTELDEALAGVGQEQDPVETIGRLGARLILQQRSRTRCRSSSAARYERTEEPVSHRNGYEPNSAGQAALHLARFARSVTLVVRAQSLEAGMSHYLVREVEATPNVEVRTGTAVVGGGGEGRLQELVLRQSATGEESTVAADALFVLIGARPHTDWLPTEIARDERGFLLTGDELPDGYDWPLERRPFSLETSMPGVLTAGDVRHASVKRVASAVGEGSIAIQLVQSLFAYERLHSGRPTEARAPAGSASARY